MPRFLNKVTQVLGNIFNFEGSLSSLSRLDLAGDIQPVFDLSRGTGLAKATDFGTSLGLVGLRLTNTHVATGDLFNEALDLYAVEAAFFGVPVDEIWIWIMDVEAYVNENDDLVGGQATVIDPAIQGTAEGAGRGRLLANWTVSTGLFFEGGGGSDEPAHGVAGRNAMGLVPMPYLLTPGAGVQIASQSDAGGALVFNVAFRLWVGPRFVNPPGR